VQILFNYKNVVYHTFVKARLATKMIAHELFIRKVREARWS